MAYFLSNYSYIVICIMCYNTYRNYFLNFSFVVLYIRWESYVVYFWGMQVIRSLQIDPRSNWKPDLAERSSMELREK